MERRSTVSASLIRTVCLTGHREIPGPHALLLPRLIEQSLLELSDESETTVFRAGGALGFDMLASFKVLELREKHPRIQLHLYLPCQDQDRHWDAPSRRAYRYLLEHADLVRYVHHQYTNGCMLERDRCLVEGSDTCLAYCTKNHGGTFYTCSYALRSELALINLADRLP